MLPEAMPEMMHLGEAEREGGVYKPIYLCPQALLLKKELPSPNPQGKYRRWQPDLQFVRFTVCFLVTKMQS